MKSFDVPEINLDRVVLAKIRLRRVWALKDLDQQQPAVFIAWRRPDGTETAVPAGTVDPIPPPPIQVSPVHPTDSWTGPAAAIKDPALDLEAQLRVVRVNIEHLEATPEACNLPYLTLVHFGTGVLATAFGSEFVVRDASQPCFLPAIHTLEEAVHLEKPDLHCAGILPQIYERIDYYVEHTRGQIPICPCDTASPMTMLTQIWHYEDVLQAMLTAPEVVHRLLALVTECYIEFFQLQAERIGRLFCPSTIPVGSFAWYPRGMYLGDDTMVAVSPAMFEEFFRPYNERISREFGGIIYHCCMRHDWQFEQMAKTEGFMGFDADPAFNDLTLVEKALTGKGVWARGLGLNDLELIRRFKGKVAFFLNVYGENKQDALDKTKHLREVIAQESCSNRR